MHPLSMRALAGALATALALPALAADPTLSKIQSSGTLTIGYRKDASPLSYVDASGQPIPQAEFDGHWSLVVAGSGPCDAACRRWVVATRQIHVALYKQMPRVQRAWLSDQRPPDDAPLLALQPDLHTAVATSDAARRAFDLGHSFFEHPYDVLHFAARNGYRFVIVFTPPWPLEDFQKDLLGVFCDRMASAFDNLFLYQQLRASNEATVIALADLAEFRDESTGAHIVRVKKLTNALVAELVHQGKFPGIITETFRAMIGTAAILHDVGKVATPDHILLKPARLDDALEVITQVAMLRRASILFEQQLMRGQELLFTARVLLASIDLRRQKPVAIPASLHALLESKA